MVGVERSCLHHHLVSVGSRRAVTVGECIGLASRLAARHADLCREFNAALGQEWDAVVVRIAADDGAAPLVARHILVRGREGSAPCCGSIVAPKVGIVGCGSNGGIDARFAERHLMAQVLETLLTLAVGELTEHGVSKIFYNRFGVKISGHLLITPSEDC